jgi:MIP family channel proteins
VSAPAPPGLPRRLAAEAVGTFCLVGAGTGAVAVDDLTGGSLGVGGVAAAFGLVVAAMIMGLGHLSGAHMNPAVTIAAAAGRHFPAGEVAPYAVAQIAGALLASAALRVAFGPGVALGVTAPSFVTEPSALVIEAVLTAVLMVVILAVATDTRAVGQLAAVAVGATIALEALVMGPVTGASMNPARSLAPAVVSGDLAGLWIYLAGPVAGALAGLALYEMLRGVPRSGTAPAPAVAIDQEDVR